LNIATINSTENPARFDFARLKEQPGASLVTLVRDLRLSSAAMGFE
jgi:hypothetical protein